MELLKVSNLTKHFGGVKAVDGCSFAVEQGSITALIGPNGCGKTTVLNLISGLLKPDGGSIEFGGCAIHRLRPHKRATLGISRSFQTGRLFPQMSLLDNLMLAKQEPHESTLLRALLGRKDDPKMVGEAIALLKKVGINKDPQTWAEELSSGQRTLLALARALSMPHKLIILDEPMHGVLPALRQEFVQSFLTLKAEGDTVLLVEHDVGFVRQVADKAIVMHAGKILAESAPVEVLNHPDVIKAYLGRKRGEST